MQTFNLNDMWFAHQGEFVAFGISEDQVKNAIENPNSVMNENLVIHFSPEEWDLLAAYAQSIDRVVPQTDLVNDGEEKRPGEAAPLERTVTPASLNPANATYAVLSPAGRKYGTWAIMRQSTRTDTNWDIMMPDVGSAETAKRIVAILNAQGADVGPKLVARGL